MIIKFKHIENVNVTIWVSIVWLIVAVAINVTGLIWYGNHGGKLSIVMSVGGMVMVWLAKAVDFSRIISAVTRNIPCWCPECRAPASYYGIKVKPYPDTAIIYYSCGSERMMYIGDGSPTVIVDEMVKPGVCCGASEEEDTI